MTLPVSYALGKGWPIATGRAAITLADLVLSPLTATAGTAYAGTISGGSGGTITAVASDGTALTVTGSSVSGTFAAAGTPTITLTETLGLATNSPHASPAQTMTVAAASGVSFAQPYNRIFLPTFGDSRPAQDGSSYGVYNTSTYLQSTTQSAGPTGFLHSLTNGRTIAGSFGNLGIGGQTVENSLNVPRNLYLNTTFNGNGSISGNVMTIPTNGYVIGGVANITAAVINAGCYVGGTGQWPPPKILSGSAGTYQLDSAPNMSLAGCWLGTMGNTIWDVAQSPAANIVFMGGTNSGTAALGAGGIAQTMMRNAFRALTDPTFVYPPTGAVLPLYSGLAKNCWVIDEEPQGVLVDGTLSGTFGRSTARVAEIQGWVDYIRKHDATSGDALALQGVKVAKVWDDTRFYDPAAVANHGNIAGLLTDGAHSTGAGGRVLSQILADVINANLDLSTDFKRVITTASTPNTASCLLSNPTFNPGSSAPTGSGTYVGNTPLNLRFNNSVAGVTYVQTTTLLPGNEGYEYSLRCYGTSASGLIVTVDTLLSTAAKNAMHLQTKQYRFEGYIAIQIDAGNIGKVTPFAAVQASTSGNTNFRVEAAANGSLTAFSAGNYTWWKYPFAGADVSHGYEYFQTPNIDFTGTGAPDTPNFGQGGGLEIGVQTGVAFDITVKTKRWSLFEV